MASAKAQKLKRKTGVPVLHVLTRWLCSQGPPGSGNQSEAPSGNR